MIGITIEDIFIYFFKQCLINDHISEASEWQCLKEIVGIIKSSKDGVPFLKQVQNIVTIDHQYLLLLSK